MPVRCQEVIVVKLIGAAKRRWAGIADNVCFPGELKLGGKKATRDVGLSPCSLPEVQPFIFTCSEYKVNECHPNVVNDTVNDFQHEHDLNMNLA